MSKKALTKDEIFALFKKDMARGPEMALYSSFRRYATLRDELIKAYSNMTSIPEEEFYDFLAMEQAKVYLSI